MMWVIAPAAGALLGLLYFGGLWLTVRLVLLRQGRLPLVAASRLARLALLGLVLYALCRADAGYALAALPGFWLARWSMLRHLGEVRHASH